MASTIVKQALKSAGDLRRPLKAPIHLKNGDRISGYTDDTKEVYYGYDKNNEIFSIKKSSITEDQIDPSKGRTGRNKESSLNEIRSNATRFKMLSKGIAPAAAGGAFLTAEDAEATFGGIVSAGSKMIIANAAKLDAKGMPREDIWKATFDQFGRGAFKGDDGLWRVEFDDYIEQLSYRDGFERLSEVLNKNEINQAHDFSDTLVQTDQFTSGGRYRPGVVGSDGIDLPPVIIVPRLNRLITDSEPEFADVQNAMNADFSKANNKAKSTLLHETQHRIQDIEGFGPGSSPEYMGSFEKYKSVTGEVEARNVQARAGMTTDQKYRTPPWETEDFDGTRIFLQGQNQRDALKRQRAFLAGLGLSGGAISANAAVDNPEELVTAYVDNDPELKKFVDNARENGFEDQQIAEYLLSKAEPPAEYKPDEPYAAIANRYKVQDLTPEEVETARKEGFSDQDIARYQARNAVIDYDKISKDEVPDPEDVFRWESDVPSESDEPMYHELTEDRIKQLGQELGVDPRTQTGINAIYSEAQRLEFMKNSRDSLKMIQEVYHVDRPWAWMKATFGSNEASRVYKRINDQLVDTHIRELKERGIDAEYHEGQYFGKDKNGELQPITPGFMEEMGAMKYEAIGGIGGAYLGGVIAVSRNMGLYGRAFSITAGGLAGMIAGDQIDYLSASMEAQEEWNAKLAAEKAVGTAQFGVLTEIGIFAGMKLGKAGWNTVSHWYRTAADGNSKGANEFAKRTLSFISDADQDEAIARWEKLNEMDPPGKNIYDKRLAISSTTMPGGEAIIGASVKKDPAASAAISSEINTRAREILRIASSNAPEDTGAKFIANLKDYERNIKTHFQVVKNQGSDLAPENFRFQLDKIAIKPLIEHKMNTIDDPAILSRLQNVLTKIDQFTETRTFDDLLDLRRTINDFKFNRRIVKKTDFDTINETLANIDDQIEDAVKTSPDGEQWLTDWKNANYDYSQYAQIRARSLWKATVKKHADGKGVSEASIARELIKYGPSIDSSYEDVVSKLSPKVRAGVEGSIVEQLIQKYTLGKEGEFRAIRFPELTKALRPYDLKTPDASRMKEAIRRLSEVYQNDPKIAASSGHIEVPGFQSYLSTEVSGRLHMAALSEAFNYVRQYIPGNKADSLSMVNKISKLLEEPLNVKTVEGVMKTIQEEEALTAAVKRLQAQVAKEQAQGDVTRIKLYTSGGGREYTKPVKGARPSSESLPIHRLVPEQMAKETLGGKKVDLKKLTKSQKLKLIDAGFIRIRMDNGELIKLEL